MTEWNSEISASFTNWLGYKTFLSYRVPDAIYQFVMCEAADWSSETGWGDISVLCAATSDYFAADEDDPVIMPDDTEDGLGSGGAYDAHPTELNHNQDFADFVKATWAAERTRRGIDDNAFMDATSVTGEVGLVRTTV